MALLIDSSAVYQCMRFDGYRALAALTSIPDFFSRRSAFLRSVLPLWCWKGTRLPNLKTWMRIVFPLRVTVTVLALLLFLLVTRLPSIVVVAWGSLSTW